MSPINASIAIFCHWQRFFHTSLERLCWQKPAGLGCKLDICRKCYTQSHSVYYFNLYQPAIARLQLDELLRSEPRRFHYSNKSIPQPKQNNCPSFNYLPEVKHKILSNFYALKPSQNNKATSIEKSLPVEGNYDKLEGYAIKNCTKLQDELPTQQ